MYLPLVKQIFPDLAEDAIVDAEVPGLILLLLDEHLRS